MSEISDEIYEQLRLILEKNSKAYSLEDAKEIGQELVEFYSLLLQLDEESEDEEGQLPYLVT